MHKIVVKNLGMMISTLRNVIDFDVFGNALNQLSAAIVLGLLPVAIWIGARVLALLRELY